MATTSSLSQSKFDEFDSAVKKMGLLEFLVHLAGKPSSSLRELSPWSVLNIIRIT
jgi:hypothetical protein